MDMGMLLIKALVLGCIVTAVLGFILIKFLSKSTEGAVQRLNRETEQVRKQQQELNDKIKQANEELGKRRTEADELVLKMKDEAASKANEEREKIIKKAREDSEEIISKAHRTKEDVRKVIEKDMELKAIDFANRVLEEILSEKSKGIFNNVLIEEFLEGIKGVDASIISADVDTVEIQTAVPLDSKYKSQLEDIIKKKMERSVKFQISENKKLIAGITLKFGTLAIDDSLHHKLEEKGVDIKGRLEKGLL